MVIPEPVANKSLSAPTFSVPMLVAKQTKKNRPAANPLVGKEGPTPTTRVMPRLPPIRGPPKPPAVIPPIGPTHAQAASPSPPPSTGKSVVGPPPTENSSTTLSSTATYETPRIPTTDTPPTELSALFGGAGRPGDEEESDGGPRIARANSDCWKCGQPDCASAAGSSPPSRLAGFFPPKRRRKRSGREEGGPAPAPPTLPHYCCWCCGHVRTAHYTIFLLAVFLPSFGLIALVNAAIKVMLDYALREPPSKGEEDGKKFSLPPEVYLYSGRLALLVVTAVCSVVGMRKESDKLVAAASALYVLVFLLRSGLDGARHSQVMPT